MILPIVTYGNFALRKKGDKITEKTNEIEILIGNMLETLNEAGGVGLAAQQVGFNYDLFVVDFSEGLDDPFVEVFMNTEIIEYSDEKDYSSEGCLSFPGLREDVLRSSKIKVRFLDSKFEEKEVEFEGFLSRIIQHEYDHTRGILFIDRMAPLVKKMLSGKLTDITKGKFLARYKVKK